MDLGKRRGLCKQRGREVAAILGSPDATGIAKDFGPHHRAVNGKYDQRGEQQLRVVKSPGFYSQRIGADHRLLFRLTPDRLVIVDLINRRDLERRIKSLASAS